MEFRSAHIASMVERDTMFAAYRSWKAVTTALVAQVDAAVQGQPTDWARFDAKLELWRVLQDQFLGTLKSCADAQPSHASPPGPPDVAVERGTSVQGVAESTQRQGGLSASMGTWQSEA
jgi:hypothetical protein